MSLQRRWHPKRQVTQNLMIYDEYRKMSQRCPAGGILVIRPDAIGSGSVIATIPAPGTIRADRRDRRAERDDRRFLRTAGQVVVDVLTSAFECGAALLVVAAALLQADIADRLWSC